MLSEAQTYNAPENVLSIGEILPPNASYGRIVGNPYLIELWKDCPSLAKEKCPAQSEAGDRPCYTSRRTNPLRSDAGITCQLDDFPH